MGAKKAKIVIIGAGMAGLTAANKLYTSTATKDLFELCVVEGGTRIGGRINTSDFCGKRIEMGATWIHGIEGSPIHKIAQETNSLVSEQPWEWMDGFPDEPTSAAEGGFKLSPSTVEPITDLFNHLMDYAQGKKMTQENSCSQEVEYDKIAAEAYKNCTNIGGCGKLSLGSFLREGLNAYWNSRKGQEQIKGYGTWSKKLLEEALFAMHENTQRTYTSAGDLFTLDFKAESEYRMFPGEEITIARGYLSIIERLASDIPPGVIQLGRKVTQIEWCPEAEGKDMENGYAISPVKIHFCDGTIMSADHVIVTVSLGVLKAGICREPCMFNPPLPDFKTEAIKKLGFGVVNKLFLQVGESKSKFPSLQMAFHRPDSKLQHDKIPWWMRRTASISPIYNNSNVLLSWFAGEEAVELESLDDEEIINGVSTTISSFLLHSQDQVKSNSSNLCNGNANSLERCPNKEVKFTKVLKSKWGSDPLFLGSYSYVAVGSSGDDLDIMAEPLPRTDNCVSPACHPLQILFAGEATHRTHYSTTHGAYCSGLREANRLLEHYGVQLSD